MAHQPKLSGGGTLADVIGNPTDEQHRGDPLAKALCDLGRPEKGKASDLLRQGAWLEDCFAHLQRIVLQDDWATLPAGVSCDVNLLSLLAREIIDAYIIEQRQALIDMMLKFHGVQERSGDDIPLIRHLVRQCEHRTPFEQANKVLLVPEGELYFGIYLHRLVQRISLAGKLPAAAALYAPPNGVRFLNEDSRVSGTGKRMLEWLRETLTDSRRSKLRDALFCAEKPPHRGYPRGFGLTETQCGDLAALAQQLLRTDRPPPSDVDRLFSAFLDALRAPNELAALTDIMHCDPFVAEPFTARRRYNLNVRRPGDARERTDSHFYFFALPIDPLNRPTDHGDAHLARNEEDDQSIFAIWVGYLNHPEALPLSEARPDSRIARLRTFLSTIGQPVVREKIEGDLIDNVERATKSARWAGAAAIISRNFSHNIGSHVLSRLAADYWSRPSGTATIAAARTAPGRSLPSNASLTLFSPTFNDGTTSWRTWRLPRRCGPCRPRLLSSRRRLDPHRTPFCWTISFSSRTSGQAA